VILALTEFTQGVLAGAVVSWIGFFLGWRYL
jgi:hypothetical protein